MDAIGDSFSSLCDALRGLHEQVQELTTVHDAIDEFNQVFGAFQNAMALHASCLEFPKPKAPAPPPPMPTGIPKPTGIPRPQIVTNTTASDNGHGGGAAGSASSTGVNAATTQGGPRTTAKLKESGARPGTAPSNAGPTKKTGMKSKAGPPRGKRPVGGRGHAAAAAAKKQAKPETAPWKWDKNLRDNIPRKYQSEAELAKLENILIYLKNRQSGITIADLVKHSGLAVIRCKEILQTLTKLNLISRRQESTGFVYTFGSAES
ncbi:hypothetical protein PINS_up013343 [Pythium insidiosum]|nr:hypothetical protein PINS_up013343 [Pythium insidiosum]